MPDLRVRLHGWKSVDWRCPDICLQENLHELGCRFAHEARFQFSLHFVAILQHISRIIALESIYSDEFCHFAEWHHGDHNVSIARLVNAHGSSYTEMPDSRCAPLRL